MSLFGSIRGRLLYGTLALALVPLLAATVLIAALAYRDARSSLSERAIDQLTSIRTVKQSETVAYMDSLRTTVRVLAQNPFLRDSAVQLRAAFGAAGAAQTLDIEAQRTALKAYYENDFIQQYEKRNPGGQVAMGQYVAQLPAETVTLQYQYIASNPNPLGRKNDLNVAPGETAYNQLHAALHPFMRQVVEQYGFYDVFLIDPETGYVVYTFFKELDFSTSLINGPWAETGLADAFRSARDGADPDQPVLVDFRKYLPSYDDGAAFFAVPMVQDGQVIAVFAAQVPLNKIEEIASFRANWAEAGLGATGEMYLIGPDELMRTTSRGMVQNVESFLGRVAALGYDASAVSAMRARKATVGLLKVNTDASRAALAGQTGAGSYRNLFGETVLGAYAPIDIGGLNWGLVTEIHQQEALAPANALLQRIAIGATVVGLLLALIAAVVANRLARSINTPVSRLSNTVGELNAGNMDARVQLQTRDELGQLGGALDRLLDERVATLAAAARENEQLNESVITIMQAVGQLAQNDLTIRVPVTADVTGAVSDAINLLVSETSGALRNVLGVANQVAHASVALRNRTTTVFDTAQNSEREVQAAATELKTAADALAAIAQEADDARAKAEDALRTSTQGLRIVSDTVHGVTSSRDQIRETEKRVKRLAERSTEINGVVNIINQIAERTAVLALNAGMQAAAAGDAGRGFAVVADEVKRLADSARNATAQISTLVTGIQADAADTMRSMNDALTQFVDITRLAERAGEEVQSSMSATDGLASAVRSIASTSTQQARISGTLIERAARIDGATRSTLEELARQRENVQSLLNQAKTLLDTVRVFKLPGA